MFLFEKQFFPCVFQIIIGTFPLAYSTVFLEYNVDVERTCSRKNFVFLFGAYINLTVGRRIFSPNKDDLFYSPLTIFQTA